MNRDDIIRMAREAGWTDYSLLHSVEARRLEQFAALVAAEAAKCETCGAPHALYCLKCCEESIVQTAVKEEREAAAKDCETLLPSQRIYDRRFYDAVGECVATIRARGEA